MLFLLSYIFSSDNNFELLTWISFSINTLFYLLNLFWVNVFGFVYIECWCDSSIIQVWTTKLLPSPLSTSLGSQKLLGHPQVGCASQATADNTSVGISFQPKDKTKWRQPETWITYKISTYSTSPRCSPKPQGIYTTFLDHRFVRVRISAIISVKTMKLVTNMSSKCDKPLLK